MKINGVAYHAEQAGQGSPILFLHGFTGCGANWLPITDPLSAAYRVMTVDLLGHGRTASPPDPARYALQNAAADLIVLIQNTVNEPVHVVGYSMGGRLALYLALFYPQWVRGLVLESASPGLADPAEREARFIQDQALADRIERQGIVAFVAEWEILPLFATQTPAQREALRTQRLQNSPLGLANSLRGMGTGSQPPLWEKLPDLQTPTCLIVGEQDQKFCAINTQMRLHLPQSQLKIVPGAGHCVHLEQPQTYRDVLKQMLA
jgi:2-succinyl-6-hydroxy-2,4-cyclohexadiene-1-carboxylate synthase